MDSGEYKHLMLAVDFEEESEPVIVRAARLRELFNARLTVLHVVEHIPPAMDYMPVGYTGDVAVPDNSQMEEALVKEAEKRMAELGKRLNVPPEDCLVKLGATGHIIDSTSIELGIDLVVIGTHGSKGLLGLFGATARQVLRNTHSDVLCVKITAPQH